jgi:hypothetical protein
MRKLVLALLILFLSVPAMATCEVRCAQVDDTNQVIVTYDDSNEIRAFGIEISVDTASIAGIDINDADYYIFPGSIDIDEAGDVNDYGSAVVDQDSNSFILEMGSLYAATDPCGHTTAPPTSGWICKFYVDGDCNVAIAENVARGGVVMADTQASFGGSLIGCQVTIPPPCFPESDPCYSAWVLYGEPECWCNPRQCYGDADGEQHTQRGLEHPFWVGSPDLVILSTGWKKPDTDPNFNEFICADFDHSCHTQRGVAYTFRVGSPDLTILATY